jgi:hypothetical protein
MSLPRTRARVICVLVRHVVGGMHLGLFCQMLSGVARQFACTSFLFRGLASCLDRPSIEVCSDIIFTGFSAMQQSPICKLDCSMPETTAFDLHSTYQAICGTMLSTSSFCNGFGVPKGSHTMLRALTAWGTELFFNSVLIIKFVHC